MNDDTVGHCDKIKGDEIYVAENVDTAGHCDKIKGVENYVTGNDDTAGHCGTDGNGEIAGTEILLGTLIKMKVVKHMQLRMWTQLGMVILMRMVKCMLLRILTQL